MRKNLKVLEKPPCDALHIILVYFRNKGPVYVNVSVSGHLFATVHVDEKSM